ncbi:MAG: RNA-directed DNA polymerase [Fibromonadaceae bacterium]|jgi:hypothetical protein|nr:RNA-directed DNA polymerase [Fibromonadaceae bacterium]
MRFSFGTSCVLAEASANVSALPGGNGWNGSFNNVGNNGNWWSATENDASNAWNRNMNNNNSDVNRNNNNKENLLSVRCLQDCSGETGKPALPFFSELHKAYLDARKHKRNTINQLKFERNLEAELLSLCSELETRTYELRPGICFINELPVKREIIAADFRDRVVHHLLYNRIYHVLDRKFIYDSYSCRVGKGTSFGINRVRRFLKSHANPWVLRLDIQGFFMAINRGILFDLINRLHCEACDFSKFLIQKIVFNDPLKNAFFKSPPSAWSDLPKDKSLMNSASNCGLPIGNLTSQIFANVYLNPLDHFIKRELKIKYYGRYVDDMVLIHSDKQILLNAISRIREFMSNDLKLTLHPRKIKLQQANKGFAFLGAYIYPNKIIAGRRIIKNFRQCIFSPFANPEKQAQRVQSYLGMELS